MSTVGQREILTQRRVVAFFQDALGFAYLGHWQDRPDNSNIEDALLVNWLKRQGHDDKIITKAIRELSKATALSGSKTPYEANREVYGLLRYGVKVQPDVGEQNITVWLIDWKTPDNNNFAIAEEVTVAGKNTKRPDLVLYVNGIALGVLELKRSTVSVTEGIRQNLDSQKKEFIQPFFATVQLVMAGNDTEGLRYGVIETPEKYWLRWKEAVAHPAAAENPLLRELSQLCGKERLLEIVHDFIVFDVGVKKICRHNQYFGVQAAQARVKRREGGIIWHTQGSGKSLTMVWLAKWIREHVTDGRVLIITDRTELDEQIEKVFKGVSEDIYRTKSIADLVRVLNAGDEWLIGSLIHKFGASEEISDRDIETYIEEIKKSLPKGFHAKGEIFVFVDECHRTQSGKLHKAMRELLPGAMLIGFTGTPLLKDDKQRSIETFGPYIHTYKYDEAVGDGVVLDLRYEARNIDQNITSQAKIDQWFELKTPGADQRGEGPAQAALGHDAEGAECTRPAGEDRCRHPDRHGDARPAEERPRQRDARIRQHLLGVPLLRDVSAYRPGAQVRHRHLLQAGPGGHQGRGDRRGAHREAAPVRHLSKDAGGTLQRAGRHGDVQSRAIRAGGGRSASSTSRDR